MILKKIKLRIKIITVKNIKDKNNNLLLRWKG